MPRRIDPTGLVGGLNAVEALIRSDPRRIRSLVVQRSSSNTKLHALQKLAQDSGLRVRQLPSSSLDAWLPDIHQGVIAFCETRSLDDWEPLRDRLLLAKKNGKSPIIVVPAALEDPRNLGACVRTAAGLGVDAILLPNKGSTGLTSTAGKAAAGMETVVPTCRVRDIEKEIKILVREGFLALGLDAKGTKAAHVADLRVPLVLVLGGEDRGIPPHIARTLSGTIKLPMAEVCHSYNASVALAILLYETSRQRNFANLKP